MENLCWLGSHHNPHGKKLMSIWEVRHPLAGGDRRIRMSLMVIKTIKRLKSNLKAINYKIWSEFVSQISKDVGWSLFI